MFTVTKKSRLQVQQKITVALLPGDTFYKSTIQDMDGETVSVSLPVKDGKYLLLQKGDSVNVEFAVNDAVYSFQTEILGRRKSNNVPLIVMRRPMAFSRRQRRSYVRFPVILAFSFRFISGAAGVQSEEQYTAKTVDLSGGGLQAACMKPILAGETLLITLKLDDGNPHELRLTGKVAWVVKDEWTRASRFGIQFDGIRETDQERIISYIFNLMRQRTQL